MEITPIPCLTDNYAYIIYDNNSKTTGVVDPSESQPIVSFLKRKNIKLNYILNTHHHFDHIGGNIELKKTYNAQVVGFDGDKHRIPGIDVTVKNNEQWNFGNSSVKILHIPGHTLGHICFFFEKEKIAFTGDTLFSLGCGRIFEGTYLQMYKSLNFFKSLPLDTKVFCGHEYTLQNSKFCIKYDPNNKNLKNKIINIKKNLENNLPTIPSTIKDELECNIFLRSDNLDIQTKLNLNNNNSLETFSKLRDLKDNF